MEQLYPAIKTEFDGTVFRSKLEAKWATFLKIGDAKYEYEAEGYELGGGTKYLPDFLIRNVKIMSGNTEQYRDVYIEVKGVMDDVGLDKVSTFCGLERKGENWVVPEDGNPVLVVGNFPNGTTSVEIVANILQGAGEGCQDLPVFYNFWTITGMDKAAIPALDLDGKFCISDYSAFVFGRVDKMMTQRAYYSAKNARFDHGEDPNESIKRAKRQNDIEAYRRERAEKKAKDEQPGYVAQFITNIGGTR